MILAIPLFDRSKLVIEILLREMAMKSLDCQLMLMALAMVYAEMNARGNTPIHCTKLTGISMQSLAVAGVNLVHIVIAK